MYKPIANEAIIVTAYHVTPQRNGCITLINTLSYKIKLPSMKNSFYKLLLIFSVKDIRWSLPMDRELDSL